MAKGKKVYVVVTIMKHPVINFEDSDAILDIVRVTEDEGVAKNLVAALQDRNKHVLKRDFDVELKNLIPEFDVAHYITREMDGGF